MNNTQFESTYDDYILAKIYDNVENFSMNTLYIEIDVKKFEKLIFSNFENLKKYQNITSSFSKTTHNLEPYIVNTLIGDNFAVTYNYSNRNEDSDTVTNFNYNKDGIFLTDHIVLYYNDKTELDILKLIPKILKLNKSVSIKNRFYTIGADMNGFRLNVEKTSYTDIDLKLNYGSKFIDIHDEIYNALKNEYSGLLLLHGEPGTGKTMYIRHLISLLCNDKTIIYVPAFMIEQIANPEFITFIQRYKESILILEDAEVALQSRQEEYGAQAVSNLLNITNGLLNDVTKIQVIATFNMDKKNIDKALLRPGRLIKEVKFDKLSIDDTKELCKFLNKDIEILSGMTLAEIYSGKTTSKKTKKRIGIKDEE